MPAGSTLSISFCDIKNAKTGISAEPGAGLSISYSNITNCEVSGIAILGFGIPEESQTFQTPFIYRNSINNSGTGIFVITGNEIVIKENSLTDCGLGIYVYFCLLYTSTLPTTERV